MGQFLQNLWRWLLGVIRLWVLPVVVLACALGLAGIELAETTERTPLSWWKFGLVAIVAIVSFGQAVIIYKNQKNFGDGLQQGHQTMQNSWKEVSRHFESAQNSNIDALFGTPANKMMHANAGIQRLLNSYLSIVVAVFREVAPGSLTVTLGVPTTDGKKITIASIFPEANGRRRGNKYDVPDALGDCHSMSRAFRSQSPVYTPDTERVPALEHKPYRSIFSVPLSGKNGEIVGVLNIDTTEMGAFGEADPNNPELLSVFALSLPIQRAVAHLLLSTNLYSEYKS